VQSGHGVSSRLRLAALRLDSVLILQAVENRLDPVIGRSREVARVMQILARRRKNNPMLLGEPGVGKTAIAEGLALAIVNGKGDDGTELPLFLKGGLKRRRLPCPRSWASRDTYNPTSAS